MIDHARLHRLFQPLGVHQVERPSHQPGLNVVAPATAVFLNKILIYFFGKPVGLHGDQHVPVVLAASAEYEPDHHRGTDQGPAGSVTGKTDPVGQSAGRPENIVVFHGKGIQQPRHRRLGTAGAGSLVFFGARRCFLDNRLFLFFIHFLLVFFREKLYPFL